MGGFIQELGIDWKLLLSQAVNFFILLIVLRAFVYKPVLKILKKRQERIEEGLAKAAEADVRLKEIDEISKNKLKEAEKKAISVIKQTEEKAKELEGQLLAKAREKEEDILKKAELVAEAKKEEAAKLASQEVVSLVQDILVKTVGLSPEKIDEALIKKAASEVTKHEKISA